MNFVIASNDFFTIEHCYSCAVPGYLVVAPTIASKSVHELPQSFQQRLGPGLALATRLTQEMTRPLKLYCAQFGEEESALHFHVFPRTRSVTKEFLESFPEQGRLIHGPVLLDWARSHYQRSREDVWSIVEPTVIEMRNRLPGLAIGTGFVAGVRAENR